MKELIATERIYVDELLSVLLVRLLYTFILLCCSASPVNVPLPLPPFVLSFLSLSVLSFTSFSYLPFPFLSSPLLSGLQGRDGGPVNVQSPSGGSAKPEGRPVWKHAGDLPVPQQARHTQTHTR